MLDSKKVIDEIVGTSVEDLTLKHLKSLNRNEIVRVFGEMDAPAQTELIGEHKGEMLSAGLVSPLVLLYVHRLFGPGRWIGKGFEASETGDIESGYNIFVRGESIDRHVNRVRRFRAYLAPSRFDDLISLHIDYSPYNRGLAATFHDELRQIRASLYLGLGCIPIFGGRFNPFPFALSSA
ncbi:MAG: hypothetical protein JSU77_00665 [Fidelibacterota bacterium]|nr:MAG: hypothetical protein JSU77_00665 [Candidatus Neomarinimicrobiota bacterium]